jgi:prepilin-type N-terminal cleavage/methylation domain-containing protein
MLRREGFTLMEVIVVLIIIGVALGFMLPNFTQPNGQALAKSAVSNLLAIYGAQQNYYNNNGVYCIGACDTLAHINTQLSLNLQDNGLFTYNCTGTTVVSCHATNAAYSGNPITVFLNGSSGAITYPLSQSINPYSGDCLPVRNLQCPF